ncbi:MAG: acyltransferase domain-containing protein [Pseudomonadota bacterium]
MTVCIFPGQGSQVRGMGRFLFDRYPQLTERASDILGFSVRELCLKDANRELHKSEFAQPALFVVNALSIRRFREEKGEPDVFLGHSLGEANALEASGALSFEDGVMLVRKRALLLADEPPGAMAAIVGLRASEVEARLQAGGFDHVDIANYNGPRQLIIAGLRDDIKEAGALFDTEGVQYVPLNTDGAFHSRHLQGAAAAFENMVSGMAFQRPKTPVMSSIDGAFYNGDDVGQRLKQQITSPVRWDVCIRRLYESGTRTFEVVGPGRVLRAIVAEIISDIETRETPRYAVAKPSPVVGAEDAAMMPDGAPAPTSSDATHPRSRPIHKTIRETIAHWNQAYPVGTRVRVDGYDGLQVTRTRAIILFGHRPAIYLEGFSGYVPLDAVVAA